jgi:hypothetical protein
MNSKLVLGMTLLALALPAASRADKFVQSDTYKEGDEVVGKFLTDAEYQLMVDDVERNDEEFDWTWVSADKPNKPKTLKFSLQGKKVHILEVPNLAGLTAKNLPPLVAENVGEALKIVGAEIVTDPAAADYELGMAIVDSDKGGGWAPYVGRIEPSVELELRLRDKSGQNLLLIRHQEHGGNGEDAVLEFADELSKFLR